jgi:hypothetical protein
MLMVLRLVVLRLVLLRLVVVLRLNLAFHLMRLLVLVV